MFHGRLMIQIIHTFQRGPWNYNNLIDSRYRKCYYMFPERESLKPRGAGRKVEENKLKLASGFVKYGEAMSW
jgi:hypothetical protein